jgi:N-acetylmuramoyl-L-alanine amidase
MQIDFFTFRAVCRMEMFMKANGKWHGILAITLIAVLTVFAVTVLTADAMVLKNLCHRIFQGLSLSKAPDVQSLMPSPVPMPSSSSPEVHSPAPVRSEEPAAVPEDPAPTMSEAPAAEESLPATEAPTAEEALPATEAPAAEETLPAAETPAESDKPSPTEKPLSAAGHALAKWPAMGSVPILYHPGFPDSNPPGQMLPLAGLTVIVDPGHGGSDVGAEWTGKRPAVYEAPINLAVSVLLRDRLTALGAKVIMTRTTDTFLSLHYRAAMTAKLVFSRHRILEGADGALLDRLAALFQPSLDLNTDAYSGSGRSIFKGLGADEELRTILDIEKQHADMVFVSIHCNNLPGTPSVNGLQVFWSGGASVYSAENKAAKKARGNEEAPINPSYQFYDDAGRALFAETLWTAMTDTFPNLHATGGVQDVATGNFAVLREINLVSAIVEMGFLSNADDRADLLSDAGRDSIAAGVAEGVARWYLSEFPKE